MHTERWLITGASGQLGSHVMSQLSAGRGPRHILGLVGRHGAGAAEAATKQVDLADHDALSACVAAFRPTHVVHLGAMTTVSDCCVQPALAERVNTEATRVLAEAAGNLGARLVFSSTDMVFDGEHAPYRESDPARPLSHYGRTKLAAERCLAGFPNTLVVRLPLMYGLPADAGTPRQTTFVQQLAALRSGQPLKLFTDEFRTPIWLADAARVVIALALCDLTGLIHVAGPERLSRYELIARCAALLGISRPNLIPVSRLDIAAAEPRPADLSLDSRRFVSLFPGLTPGPLRPEVFSRG